MSKIASAVLLGTLVACSLQSTDSNLIGGGGFEEGGPEQYGWEWALHAGGEHFNRGTFQGGIVDDESHTGRRSLMIQGLDVGETPSGRDPARAGYWNRSIRFKRGRIYTLSFFYKTSPEARGSVYVGANNEYDLAPTHSWQRSEIISTFSEGILIRLWGEGILWIDDVRVVETPSHVASPLVVGERTFGLLQHETSHSRAVSSFGDKECVIFSKAHLGILPGDFPQTADLVDSLSIAATPGEFESATFAVLPLKDVGRIEVESTSLVGPRGEFLGTDVVELRRVVVWIQRLGWVGDLCAAVPELLVSESGSESSAGVPTQFWITLQVPEKAIPGKYVGRVIVSCERASPTEIPFCVEVLPFTLAEVPYPRVMWYDNYRIRKAKEGAKRDFVDMHAHGMSSVVYAYPDFTLFESPWQRFRKDRRVDFSEEDRWIAAYRESGLGGPIVLELTRLARRVFEHLGERPVLGTDPAAALVDEANSPSGFESTYGALIGTLGDYADQREWPQVMVYPVDEPTTASERLRTAAYQYRLISEYWPEAEIVSTTYDIQNSRRLQPWVDVMVIPFHRLAAGESTNWTYRDEAEIQEDRLWTIAWPGNDERNGFEKGRYASGFGFLKTEAEGIVYWLYQHPWRYGQNGRWNELADVEDATKHPCVAYPSPVDGSPVPTLQWEGIREGIDDARYFHTLQELVHRLPEGVRAGYEMRLDSLLSAVPWIEGSIEWTAVEAPRMRSVVARMIVEVGENLTGGRE